MDQCARLCCGATFLANVLDDARSHSYDELNKLIRTLAEVTRDAERQQSSGGSRVSRDGLRPACITFLASSHRICDSSNGDRFQIFAVDDCYAHHCRERQHRDVFLERARTPHVVRPGPCDLRCDWYA